MPSAFVLFVMRELPAPAVKNREEESRTIAFITDAPVAVPTIHPQYWTAATSVQNQVLSLSLSLVVEFSVMFNILFT